MSADFPQIRHAWPLRRWLGLMSAVALALLIAATAGGASAIAELQSARLRLVNTFDPAARAVLTLSNALVNQETGVRGFVLSPQEPYLAPYTSGRAEEQAAVKTLERLIAKDLPQLRGDLLAVLDAAQAWQTRYAEPAIAALRASPPGEPPSEQDGQALFDAVRSALENQERHMDTLHAQARRDLDRAARALLWIAIGVAVALLAGVGVLTVGLRRAITNPITDLTGQVRAIAQGDFERPMIPGGPAELVQLSGDVDSMRRRILAELSASRNAHAELDVQARELQRSNAELEQFAYVASHDLQEPLRKVASFCQLLEQRYHDRLDDRGRQYIGFAVDGAKRMQILINDLLAFSRVGRMSNEHVVVDADDLLAVATANLASVIEETGATIDAEPLPQVQGDVSLLTAVWQNLIGNALKFRQPEHPPVVRISVRPEAEQWLFTCSDNGIGIDSEYADRIFVIFQRLHPKETYPGTGIGLAMCRKIIEYHGGRIWLDTERSTPGSTFHFTLPRVDSPEDRDNTDDTDNTASADSAADDPPTESRDQP